MLGFKRWRIRILNSGNIWILTNKESNVTGISEAPHASFTLGKQNWTIVGDTLNKGKPYSIELKMSGCNKTQFTCNDGQCVGMRQRCNQLSECRDESDENNCNVMILKDGYNKNIPPITADDENVNVFVSIDLLRLVDINEEDYSIEIQFEITLMWKEKRAMYQNLKTKDSLNALGKKDIDSLPNNEFDSNRAADMGQERIKA